MDMFYVVLLVLFGVLFLVAELVFLPGVSVGAVLSLVCYGSAIYLAFRNLGPLAGVAAILAIGLLSLVATVVSLRAKTWQRFSLKQEIRSSSMPRPEEAAPPFRACRPWARWKSGAASMKPSRRVPMSTRTEKWK